MASSPPRLKTKAVLDKVSVSEIFDTPIHLPALDRCHQSLVAQRCWVREHLACCFGLLQKRPGSPGDIFVGINQPTSLPPSGTFLSPSNASTFFGEGRIALVWIGSSVYEPSSLNLPISEPLQNIGKLIISSALYHRQEKWILLLYNYHWYDHAITVIWLLLMWWISYFKK